MGTHFRFGNGWFPVCNTQVTYTGNNSFEIDSSCSEEVQEVQIQPDQVGQVFKYLENVLELQTRQEWKQEWMADGPAQEDNKKPEVEHLPVGTEVCARDDQGWFLGTVAKWVPDTKVYNIRYKRWKAQDVSFQNVVPRGSRINEVVDWKNQHILYIREGNEDQKLGDANVTEVFFDNVGNPRGLACTSGVFVQLSAVVAVLPH